MSREVSTNTMCCSFLLYSDTSREEFRSFVFDIGDLDRTIAQSVLHHKGHLNVV